MKSGAKLLILAALAFGFATRASAQVTWTFNDVVFGPSGTDSVTGSFTTNSAVTTILSFSIAVTGPGESFNAPPGDMSSTYLSETPQKIGIFAASPSLAYVDLFPASPFLTSAGGVIDISSGYDCNSLGTCETLTPGSSPEVIGSPVPEPATGALMLVWVGLLVGTRIFRRGRATTHA